MFFSFTVRFTFFLLNIFLFNSKVELKEIPNQDSSVQNDAQPTSNYDSSLEVEYNQKFLLYPYDVKDKLNTFSVVKPVQQINLPFALPYFGFRYNYLMINMNGYIAFNRGLLSYNFPIQFPASSDIDEREEDPSIIAPWFSQQEFPRTIKDAGIYFRSVEMNKETNQTFKERVCHDFGQGMVGSSDFLPTNIVIVTWKNATYGNPQNISHLQTNTYQVVIATDEKRTYAMFNYEWISWFTHLDNFEGRKGPQAFIGFNGGNNTRSFELRPYSQSPLVAILTKHGFGNDVEGRYFFRIDEEILSGFCQFEDLLKNSASRPFTVSPKWGHMLGGTLVEITGPCLSKWPLLGKQNNVTVKFDTINVECKIRSTNRVTCISPPLMYRDNIDLTISLDGNISSTIRGVWFIQSPENYHQLKSSNDNDRKEKPETIDLTWNSLHLSSNRSAEIEFHLWGANYSKSGSSPQLVYITRLTSVGRGIKSNEERFQIAIEQFKTRQDGGKTNLTFGFISANLTRSDDVELDASPVLWSRAMPLAWYFKPQWDNLFGEDNWKKRQCESWYEKELKSVLFTATLSSCPCTKRQAEFDRGRFLTDNYCNAVERNCETFHHGARECFVSGRPSVEGAGQICCYDAEGELMQNTDTIYGGQPQRSFRSGKHPYKQLTMIPLLSNWMNDVMPFFSCCKWSPDPENSETCNKFKFLRPSQNCSSYNPPIVASIYGDPHILNFDQSNYTFNGNGEFVLVQIRDQNMKLNVQGRFEQLRKVPTSDRQINGTVLTSIVVRDNVSSTVELRVRPIAANWRQQIFIIVDRQYVYWDDLIRRQSFRGVTLYQPNGIRNQSHIIAMFDSGSGVEVKSENGYLSAHIFIPHNFRNITQGLLGKLSSENLNDIQNGDVIHNRKLHQDLVTKWRLTENGDVDKTTFFLHDSLPFFAYDFPNFNPEYRFPPPFPEKSSFRKEELFSVCSNSFPCIYDFIVTENKAMAKSTKLQEFEAIMLADAVKQKVIRCPALPVPSHGRKNEIKTNVGSIVKFECDLGYHLIGSETRQCQTNGVWSFGFDTACLLNENHLLK